VVRRPAGDRRPGRTAARRGRPAAAAGSTPSAPARGCRGVGVAGRRAEQLQARIDAVGDQLARDAIAYEAAEDELALLTRKQFDARTDRDALLVASQDARQALHGLARAAYKGGSRR
jgi:hypothetical protein